MKKDIDSFRLYDSIGYVLNRTARRIKLLFLQTFERNGYDITPEQWAILNRLWEKEGQSQKNIADRIVKDTPNTSRIIDILVKKKLVTRQVDELDRRNFKINLTQAGRDLKEKFIPLAVEVIEKALVGFHSDERKYLIKMLNRIYDNLK